MTTPSAVTGATTVAALAAALEAWLAERVPGATVSLLPADRGTGAVPGAPNAARDALRAQEPRDDEDGTSWWPLLDEGGPLGVLGVRRPSDGAEIPSELPLLATLALGRLYATSEAAVHRWAGQVLGDTSGGYVIASNAAQLIHLSAGFERLVGRTAAEIRATGYFEAVYPDPAWRARAVASTRRAFAGDPAAGVSWSLGHADGREVPVRLHSHVFQGEDGTRYILAHFSERVPEAPARAGSDVERHLAELGRFAGAVNHDFNNFLAVFRGRAELLAAHVDPAVRVHAAAMLETAGRGARLTRQLALFATDQPVFVKSTELWPVAEAALRVYRGSEGAPMVMLACPMDLPPVEVEPRALELALLNLLQNAGEAAGPGGRVVLEADHGRPPEAPRRSWARASVSPNWVRVRITDSGPGFDADARNRVFEPFFSTKGVGRGLGLSAVARAMERIGGMIDLPELDRRGGVVDLWLPQSPRAELPPEQRRDPVAGGAEQVWVVDDDEAVREVVALGLELHGYQVRQFATGGAVLEAAARGDTLHLLVSDVVMPGLDGFGLYRELRARGHACAVLFLSGHVLPEAPREVKTALLTKPASARVIAENARRLLNYVV